MISLSGTYINNSGRLVSIDSFRIDGLTDTHLVVRYLDTGESEAMMMKDFKKEFRSCD